MDLHREYTEMAESPRLAAGAWISLIPSLSDLAFLTPILVLFWCTSVVGWLLTDSDTGWHIRAGEWILNRGRVPATDLFSFTKAGQPCGGNGSMIAAGLPYLHQALLAYGHPEGIHVTLLDPEVVSTTNCVRQPFSQSENGLYKSVVLANRLNLFWGLDWQGIPERLDPKRRLDGVDIVIGCVDTRKARAAIAKCAED
jgi:hypothetical protein